MDLERNLKIDSVARLNPTQPLCIKPEDTVAHAVAIMRREKVGCLLICEKHELIGIFTERDLLRRVLAEDQALDLPVSNFMTPKPVTVQSKQPVSAAVRLMEEGGYRHLPVVNEAGCPVGVLSV